MTSPRVKDRSRPERILQQITASVSDRVTPACRHFGVCGGCQLQDLAYPVQVKAKQAMLSQLLQESGIRNVPEVQIHTAAPYRYRNRVRMRVQDFAVGYSMRASHAFLPVEECPILSPVLWRAATSLHEAVSSGRARWPSDTESFELFTNVDEQALQLSIHLDATMDRVQRSAPDDLRALCEAVRPVLPELAGAGLLVSAPRDPALTKRVQEAQRIEIARWGSAEIAYEVAGQAYRITRNAFFQVNRFLTEAMVRVVLAERHGDLAYDLFAGAGLFSVSLTERFRRVVAVEVGEPAASDLAAQLRSRGDSHTTVRSTAQSFLERENEKHTPSPDLITLDPPRAGLGPATVRSLLARGAREIVYVSCDAGTFAADAVPLVHSGYSLATLHLLDLFPQTFHTETIAVFRR